MKITHRILETIISQVEERPEFITPTKKVWTDAGWDLYAVEDIVLKPRVVTLLKLGFKMELPRQSFAMITPRSGLAFKEGITIVNSPGIIDEDYREEVGVILFKLTDGDYEIKRGDRIAQMVIMHRMISELNRKKKLNESNRRGGGFGSSGT